MVQVDPHAPLALPRVEADELAASIEEDATPSSRPGGPPLDLEGIEGLEDEDLELQAALQASLMGGNTSRPVIPPAPRSAPSRSFSIPFASTSHHRTSGTRPRTPPRQTIPRRSQTVIEISDDDDDDDEADGYHTPLEIPLPHFAPPAPVPPAPVALDPVEASRARSQAFMDHVLRQQQAAFQEQYAEEAARVAAGIQSSRRSTRQMEEDDELERAIEASRALAEAQGHAIDVDDDDDDVYVGLGSRGGLRSGVRSGSGSGVGLRDDDLLDELPVIPPRPSTFEAHRVYDDDDEDLQAALRASLETVPEGFRVPDTPPLRRPLQPRQGSITPPRTATGSTTTRSPATNMNTDTSPGNTAMSSSSNYNRQRQQQQQPPPPVDRSESVDSGSMTDGDYPSEVDSSFIEEPAPVSVEEMRRRRLAKFGG